jgi:hypothetical protein
MAYQALVTKNNALINILGDWSSPTTGFLFLQKLEAVFLFIEYSSMKSA